MNITRQQYDNLWIAYLRWQDVDPASVRLYAWKCGTFACFGGHCAAMPEFRAMGLRLYTYRDGVNIKLGNDDTGWLYSEDVAAKLFGFESLFYTRGFSPYDSMMPEEASDWEAVRNRLEYAIISAEITQ